VAKRIRVSTVINASRRRVWEAVRDIGSHVQWMEDAETIRFTSPRRSGVGTTFECDSRLGPLRLTDRMQVVEWREGRGMAIRHVGTVTGLGRFSLRRRPQGTLFVWEEELRFPWWMGGRLGSALVSPLFRLVWRRNVANLKRLVEAGRVSPTTSRSRARRR
jgi:predicted RNA binding protein YcfA (HicA-like mRNA interferase family)